MTTRVFRPPTPDRIITVTVASQGYRNEFGEWVPGTETDYPTWAALRGVSAGEDLAAAGNRAVGDAIWRVRWTADLAAASTLTATVTDEHGQEWGVDRIIEVTGADSRTRRRWLDIEASAETS